MKVSKGVRVGATTEVRALPLWKLTVISHTMISPLHLKIDILYNITVMQVAIVFAGYK